MFRPSHGDAAAVEELDHGFKNLPPFFVDRKSEPYSVPCYPDGCDLQYSIAREWGHTGFFYPKRHAGLTQESV